MGLYKSKWDSPLGEDGALQRDDDAVVPKSDLALAADAVATASAASGSGGPAPKPAEETAAEKYQLVRNSSNDTAELRKRCRNTMIVCGAVLLRPGLREPV